MEDGVVPRQRVVAGVIAEGPFEPALGRIHRALEDDLGFGGHLDVHRLALDHGHARSTQPAGEDHLVDARRQRRRGGVDRGRVSAQRDGDVHRPAPLLRETLVLGRALVDLPVHAERAIVVDLEPVHAHVARAAHRILREDHRKRDEAPRVPRPAAQHRQRREARPVGLDDLLARRRAHALGAGLGDVEEIAELLELLDDRARHPHVEELRDARRQVVQVLDAERRRHALRRAEGVDEHGRVEPLDVLEQERLVQLRRALRDAVGDLGDLEVAGDAGAHPLELSRLVEVCDELAEVVEGHALTRGSRASRASPR